MRWWLHDRLFLGSSPCFCPFAIFFYCKRASCPVRIRLGLIKQWCTMLFMMGSWDFSDLTHCSRIISIFQPLPSTCLIINIRNHFVFTEFKLSLLRSSLFLDKTVHRILTNCMAGGPRSLRTLNSPLGTYLEFTFCKVGSSRRRVILALANTLMGKSSVPSLSCWPSSRRCCLWSFGFSGDSVQALQLSYIVQFILLR